MRTLLNQRLVVLCLCCLALWSLAPLDTRAQDAPALAEDGRLYLATSESNLRASAIDPVGGYAYFATYTIPGTVVKVRLADFTRVATLRLNADERYLASMAIDPAGGYLYVGTGDYVTPAKVVRIRLSDFTRVDALVYSNGIGGSVRALLVDSAGGFGYFAFGGGSPETILKVRLLDFTSVATYTVPDAESLFSVAAIDPAGGYAYFTLATYPGDQWLMRIKLADFTRDATIGLEGTLYSAVVDAAGGYLYVGASTSSSTIGVLSKIRLADFSRVATLTLGTTEVYPRVALLDSGAGQLYVSADGRAPVTQSHALIKVDLAAFTRTATLPLPFAFYSGSVDTLGGHIYLGTSTVPGRIVQVRLADFSLLATLTLEAGEASLRTAVIDQGAGYAYFGTGTAPGKVVRIRLADFTPTGTLVLDPGEDGLSAAVVDLTQGYAYFATGTAPGKIVKVRLSDFTRVGALTLEAGEDYPSAAAIDTDAGYAYFATSTAPGKVVRIRLADFARVDALTLNTGEDRIYGVALDSAAGYGYLGTGGGSAGYIVKIDLPSFTRVGALGPLTDRIYAAAIDPARGYAYFGTGNSGSPFPTARVEKVNLATFTIVRSFTFQSYSSIGLLAVDSFGGYLYVSSSYSPISYNEEIDAVSLTDDINWSGGATSIRPGAAAAVVVDVDRGRAYFGTSTASGQVVRVSLNNPYRVFMPSVANIQAP